ncbi:cytochrome P450 [Streptomyces sp. NPDC057539]|uniref:cytochrome P450 n=1 Tax=Streptomyces sp. NPDC057539 TaxID=3346159 RepID=UPI0036A0CAAE
MSHNDQALPFPLRYDTTLEPPKEWAQLRGQCPMATIELPSGDHATLFTRYEDIKILLADARFTRPTAADNAARVAPEGSGGVVANGTVVRPEGEAHQRWRRLVGKYFTAKRMAALRPSMIATTERLIDDMVHKGAPADLKANVGFPLPVYVICDMLGVPADDSYRFSHWSDTILSITSHSQEESGTAMGEFVQYMSAHIEAKRASRTDDLIGMLIRESEGEGQGMSDAELLDTAMGLLVAGHETTANAISKMVAMLLADRTRWEQLLADPSLVRTAVEESLRLDVNHGFGLRRYLPEAAEMAGQTLPAGTTVVCAIASANRDETVFDHADQMDLGRAPNPHLAFSVGSHSCLGQALARTEMQVALETLLRKLPTLELAVPAEELQRMEGMLVGGLREVPVRW